mgnify:CR=1 FL=1
MLKTLIIGKKSNLSKKLVKKLNNVVLISSREVFKNINILENFKDESINIIFNNFQPATKLNSNENYAEYIKSSIFVTSTVLEYFRNTNINKIIYSSSSSVYGDNSFCTETDILKPSNLHSSLKIANEKLIEKFCREQKIDYTISRIFNMFGGNDEFSIIKKIVNAYFDNAEITILNNGTAIRDFIHIDDVVEVYAYILGVKNVKILNIGSGVGNSVENILSFLENNGIKIDTFNIQREELKISTANSRLLTKVTNKSSFKKVEDYLFKELKL